MTFYLFCTYANSRVEFTKHVFFFFYTRTRFYYLYFRVLLSSYTHRYTICTPFTNENQLIPYFIRNALIDVRIDVYELIKAVINRLVGNPSRPYSACIPTNTFTKVHITLYGLSCVLMFTTRSRYTKTTTGYTHKFGSRRAYICLHTRTRYQSLPSHRNVCHSSIHVFFL